MAAATQTSPTLTPKERAQILAEHVAILALGKACYKRADFLLDLLVAQSDRHRPIKITGRNLGRKAIAARLREAQKLIAATILGRQFAVVDRFEKKNAINVGQNARRFEIEAIEKP